MKKPKQKRKRTNVRKKGASTQVNTRSRAANKRKVVNASLNVVAILVVAGAFAYGWLTGNRAPPAEEQPLTETAAAGGSQHVEPAKVQIFEEDREIGTMLVRSEEHTSELQALMRISYAVFSLKKKKKRGTEDN